MDKIRDARDLDLSCGQLRAQSPRAGSNATISRQHPELDDEEDDE